MKVLILAVVVVMCVSCTNHIHAFSAVPTASSTQRSIRTASLVSVAAVPGPQQRPEEQQSVVTTSTQPTMLVSKMIAAIITANTFVVPIVQAIVEDDNYEYGAVDAPIGIAVGGGILAILTALLPIALRGGEEAFEEIKDRDSDTFGKRNTDLLTKKKK
jgi:hypothetical protein